MTNLRDGLEHIAEGATPPAIDHSLWERGRRLRRRDRLGAAAAALSVAVLVGGLASFLVATPQSPSPADGSAADGALPSQIFEVPDHLESEGRDGLRIDRAAIAFHSGGGTVLVSAIDGNYHRVDPLPHANDSSRLLRLSPDGTQLAYVFVSPSQEDPDQFMAGVALVDLETGDIDEVAAVGGSGNAVDISSLSWSANSRWLAWSGYDTVSWDDAGPVTDTTGALGAIDTGSLAQSTTSATPGAAGVSDTGVVTLIGRRTQIIYSPATSEQTRVPFPADTDVFAGGAVSDRATTSPDGSITAVGLAISAQEAPFVTDDAKVLQRGFATDLYPQGGRSTPLGWAAPSLLVAMVESRAGSGAYDLDSPALTLFTSPDRPEDEWTYRYLVRDLPDLSEVSVAVDLIPDLDGTSSQRLTQDFPEPDFPMSPGPLSLLIGLGVAAALSVLYGLRWLWRRFLR